MRFLVFLVLFFLVCGPTSFAKISKGEYQKVMDLLGKDQFDEAIAELQSSIDEDPDQAMVYNLLGMIYLKQNESVQSAIGSFEQAVRIDPQYAEAYFNLASVYAGPANRPELAAVYFKKTLEVDPKYVKAYFGLGWFTLTTQENPVDAAVYFKKALAFFPDFAEAHYGLGLSYIQMGKAPMALQSVSQIRALGREDLAAYLESVLRGGKVSEILPPDVKEEKTSQEVAPQGSVVPPGEGGPPPMESTPLEEFKPQDPSRKSNPFQLN